VRRRLVIGAGVTTLEGVERFTLQKRGGRWVIVSPPPLM
jgi:hypothetical protein